MQPVRYKYRFPTKAKQITLLTSVGVDDRRDYAIQIRIPRRTQLRHAPHPLHSPCS